MVGANRAPVKGHLRSPSRPGLRVSRGRRVDQLWAAATARRREAAKRVSRSAALMSPE